MRSIRVAFGQGEVDLHIAEAVLLSHLVELVGLALLQELAEACGLIDSIARVRCHGYLHRGWVEIHDARVVPLFG